MPRNTKGKGKRAGKSNPEVGERNRRIAVVIAVCAAGVATFVGSAIGLDAVNSRAIDHLGETGGDGATPAVNVAWPTDASGQIWMPLAERERLSTIIANAARGGRALSSEPLALVGEAMADTGWFDGTPTLRWTHDGRIDLAGRWRAPAAAVRMGPREHLIDFSARLLPLDYPTGQSNQIFLLNPPGRRPDAGAQWEGEGLRAGLDLILLLQREGLLGQVAGIDLGRDDRAGILAIITDRGARVVWGGGPDHLRPGEQPMHVKLGRLRTLLDRTGRIDGGVSKIDVRGQQILLEDGP
ncbi:MAG: hypothetical protein AAGA55_01335 [Planctomycetota bacterium]